jgi:LmbE family N-acetylglucosaminyl deacetylase
MTITFDRRTDNGMISSENPAEVWSNWRGNEEVWLFVAPHDDDIVAGGGLAFLAAVECGIQVHAAVMSNGRMGYCSPEQQYTVADIRRRETQESFAFLGLPMERLYQFNYDDASLIQQSGRRFATDPNDPNAIAGGVGLQNTMTYILRKVKPTRVFMPNRLDMHPDHQVVNNDLMISVFHAQGPMWPELGPPLPMIPLLYEYPTYCKFASPPTMRITVSEDLAEKRLQGLALYKSQQQIDLVVESIRKAGGVEYLLEIVFDLYSAEEYRAVF